MAVAADNWSRRRFVRDAAGTALLAALVAGTGRPAAAEPPAGTVFYDPRFAISKAAASRLGRGPLQAIGGDPTELLLQVAARGPGATQRLRGVTTESVPFCLAALMPGSKLTQRRIDRDLFVWTLESKG
jgi:hypothetical protein